MSIDDYYKRLAEGEVDWRMLWRLRDSVDWREIWRLRDESLNAERKKNEELYYRISECLEKVRVFPGSKDDYSRIVWYPVKAIQLPRKNQNVYVKLTLNRLKTEFIELYDIKKHLFENNIEAIVKATTTSKSTLTYMSYKNGLPVTRDTSKK